MTRRTRMPETRPSWGWQDQAACKGESLSLFFGSDFERPPEKAIREAKAKTVCAECPVKAQCLDSAITRNEKAGVWGGLDPDEIAVERRRRQRRAAA